MTKTRIVENKRYNSDQTYRAAANAALRAVLNASPLPLPRENMNYGKNLSLGSIRALFPDKQLSYYDGQTCKDKHDVE